MIVAASEEDNEAYCLPLVPIFESIRDSLKASEIPSTDVVTKLSTTQSSAINPQAQKPNGGSAASYRDERPRAKSLDTVSGTYKPTRFEWDRGLPLTVRMEKENGMKLNRTGKDNLTRERIVPEAAPDVVAAPEPEPHSDVELEPEPVFGELSQPEQDSQSTRRNSDNRRGRRNSDQSSSYETRSGASSHERLRRYNPRRNKRRGNSRDSEETISTTTTERLRTEQDDEINKNESPPAKRHSDRISPYYLEQLKLQKYEREKREAELKKTKEHHEIAERLAHLAVYQEKKHQAELERGKKKVEGPSRWPYRTVEEDALILAEERTKALKAKQAFEEERARILAEERAKMERAKREREEERARILAEEKERQEKLRKERDEERKRILVEEEYRKREEKAKYEEMRERVLAAEKRKEEEAKAKKRADYEEFITGVLEQFKEAGKYLVTERHLAKTQILTISQVIPQNISKASLRRRGLRQFQEDAHTVIEIVTKRAAARLQLRRLHDVFQITMTIFNRRDILSDRLHLTVTGTETQIESTGAT